MLKKKRKLVTRTFFLYIFTLTSSIWAQDSNEIKANYILGYKEGENLKNQSYVLAYPSFKQGLLDGYSNSVPDSVENQRATFTKNYVDWLFNKQTSTFTPAPLNSKTIDSFSYFVGVDYGKDFRQKFFTLDAESFSQGLKDVMEGKQSIHDSEDQRKILDSFYESADHLRAEAQNNKSIELVQGREFNRALPKGITYTLIKPGVEAVFPTDKSRVTIQYSLSLLDKDNNIVNLVANRSVSMDIKNLAEGSKIAVLNMQKGENSIFSIPTSLLFSSAPDLILTHSLWNVTLISIDSFPSDKPTAIKKLPTLTKNTYSAVSSSHILPSDKKKTPARAKKQVANKKKRRS